MKWIDLFCAVATMFFLLSVIAFAVISLLSFPIQIEGTAIYITIASLVGVLAALLFMVIADVWDVL